MVKVMAMLAVVDRNTHGAPTHLVAAGDDNGC